MKRLSRGEKIGASFLTLVVLSALASSASVQHHPFSEVFPPDEDLNFGGQDAENISEVETAVIRPNQSDIVFRDSGNVEVLRFNASGGDWEFNNSEIDTNGNNITSTGGEMCIGRYC